MAIQGFSNKKAEIMSILKFKNLIKFNAHGDKIDQLLLIK